MKPTEPTLCEKVLFVYKKYADMTWSDPAVREIASRKPTTVKAKTNTGLLGQVRDSVLWDTKDNVAGNLRGWGGFLGANALPLALTFIPGVGLPAGLAARALMSGRVLSTAGKLLGTGGRLGLRSRLGRMAVAGGAGSVGGSLTGSAVGSVADAGLGGLGYSTESAYDTTALGHAFDPANVAMGAIQAPLFFMAPGALRAAGKGAYQSAVQGAAGKGFWEGAQGALQGVRQGAGQGINAFNSGLSRTYVRGSAGGFKNILNAPTQIVRPVSGHQYRGLEPSILNRLPGWGTNTTFGNIARVGSHALMPSHLAGTSRGVGDMALTAGMAGGLQYFGLMPHQLLASNPHNARVNEMVNNAKRRFNFSEKELELLRQCLQKQTNGVPAYTDRYMASHRDMFTLPTGLLAGDRHLDAQLYRG